MENKKGNIKKNFSVPADYFEDLEKQVLSKTVNAPKAVVRSQFVKPWMAIAASIVILCCVGAAWMWNSNSSPALAIDETEVDYLEGMEDELFAALMYVERENVESSSLDELADFLVELENSDLED